MTEHYVYLFHTQEFVDSKEPVIGKSTKPNFEQFKQYDDLEFDKCRAINHEKKKIILELEIKLRCLRDEEIREKQKREEKKQGRKKYEQEEKEERSRI